MPVHNKLKRSNVIEVFIYVLMQTYERINMSNRILCLYFVQR